MKEQPLRTTVIGSYPFPGWLEFASQHLEQFGEVDLAELQDDAVLVAIHDQVAAGLDVITDGEQTRLDFNLSFYGYLEGIALEGAPPRRFGPPAHDQRGRHRVTGELRAPRGLGAVTEFERLQRLASPGVEHPPRRKDGACGGTLSEPPALKASVPGPYTLSGRLIPNERYPDRYALTEALLPIVSAELEALVRAGCREICVDEPSMSCYAHREDPARFVEIFNRTVAAARFGGRGSGVGGRGKPVGPIPDPRPPTPEMGRCRLSTHLCFGNYKGRAVGPRRYAPLFPAFLDLDVEEIHVEMASREFAEIEQIAAISARKDVAVGIIDVKSYYVETVEDVVERVRLCLRHAPPERLSFAPDCGLSQTARWAARAKLQNMVAGVKRVREEMGL